MEQTIDTPYGRLDRASLLDAQQTFDTRSLLRMVEELDQFMAAVREEDGLRDDLLRLHRMAHSVINGAGLSVPASESLPELAADVSAEISEVVEVMRRWVALFERLQSLAARD